MLELSKGVLKITEILNRTQKLPSSLLMLKESLDSKKSSYEAKAEACENRLKVLKESPLLSYSSSPTSVISPVPVQATTATAHASATENDLRNKLESLQIELQ